jgi:hypothetical protein
MQRNNRYFSLALIFVHIYQPCVQRTTHDSEQSAYFQLVLCFSTLLTSGRDGRLVAEDSTRHLARYLPNVCALAIKTKSRFILHSRYLFAVEPLKPGRPEIIKNSDGRSSSRTW